MLDSNDFQTKTDLLAFHKHLPFKVRKCYVEHTVSFSSELYVTCYIVSY